MLDDLNGNEDDEFGSKLTQFKKSKKLVESDFLELKEFCSKITLEVPN